MEDNDNGQEIKPGQAYDRVVEILARLKDTERTEIIQFVSEHFKIALPQAIPGTIEAAVHNEGSPLISKVAANDIRALKEEKSPKSAVEMAAIVAFYLSELAPVSERKDGVDVEDMEKYFKQAKFKLPGRLTQLLVNAKSAGYFESVGSGRYRLNAVGYNLVAHNLPRLSDGPSKRAYHKRKKRSNKNKQKVRRAQT